MAEDEGVYHEVQYEHSGEENSVGAGFGQVVHGHRGNKTRHVQARWNESLVFGEDAEGQEEHDGAAYGDVGRVEGEELDELRLLSCPLRYHAVTFFPVRIRVPVIENTGANPVYRCHEDSWNLSVHLPFYPDISTA